jgi:hypothetical protein
VLPRHRHLYIGATARRNVTRGSLYFYREKGETRRVVSWCCANGARRYALHKMSGWGVVKSVRLAVWPSAPLPDADNMRKMPSRQCSAKYCLSRIGIIKCRPQKGTFLSAIRTSMKLVSNTFGMNPSSTRTGTIESGVLHVLWRRKIER